MGDRASITDDVGQQEDLMTVESDSIGNIVVTDNRVDQSKKKKKKKKKKIAEEPVIMKTGEKIQQDDGASNSHKKEMKREPGVKPTAVSSKSIVPMDQMKNQSKKKKKKKKDGKKKKKDTKEPLIRIEEKVILDDNGNDHSKETHDNSEVKLALESTEPSEFIGAPARPKKKKKKKKKMQMMDEEDEHNEKKNNLSNIQPSSPDCISAGPKETVRTLRPSPIRRENLF